MDLQALAPIKLMVADLKREESEIRAKWGPQAFEGKQGMRLRVIDDTIHALKQKALNLMGF